MRKIQELASTSSDYTRRLQAILEHFGADGGRAIGDRPERGSSALYGDMLGFLLLVDSKKSDRRSTYTVYSLQIVFPTTDARHADNFFDCFVEVRPPRGRAHVSFRVAAQWRVMSCSAEPITPLQYLALTISCSHASSLGSRAWGVH